MKNYIKHKYNVLIFFVFSCLMIGFLIGCDTKIYNRGAFFNESTLESIIDTTTNNTAKFSKDEVKKLLGPPTYIAYQEDNIWYYIQRKVFHGASLTKVISQKVVKVIFDDTDNIEAIMIKDNTPDENIKIYPPKTLNKSEFKNYIYSKLDGRIEYKKKNFVPEHINP